MKGSDGRACGTRAGCETVTVGRSGRPDYDHAEAVRSEGVDAAGRPTAD